VRRTFDYEHVVTFDETNVVGNVYFANHLRWQGHCRELFLAERAPRVVASLGEIALVTTRCSCEYYAQLAALDRVVVQMSLEQLGQSTIAMRFDYVRVADGAREIVARGEQEVACLRRDGAAFVPAPVPEDLRAALEPYAPQPEEVAV
jgi:enediyne core biosynthesis thioesterase